MTLTVRVISPDEHAAWIAGRPSVSFLQLPEWAGVKVGWQSESLGWFDGSTLAGAGLALYRPIPRLPQRSLAYLPEGPDIDWLGERLPSRSLADWVTPLITHARTRGAFQIKMGPPIALRRWDAETLKAAIAADPRPARIGDVTADWTSPDGVSASLLHGGWRQETSIGAGFGDVQPRYVFQVPLAGRTLDDVLAGFNQLWRRNIRKA